MLPAPHRAAVEAGLTLVRHHGLDWHASRLPRSPAPDKRSRFRPARLSQLERRTGARGFVNSGTVDHQRRSLRETLLRSIPNRMMWIDADRSRHLG